MQVETFFDQDTFTLTYLIFDPTSKDTIIIDPVLNFDYASGSLFLRQLHQIIDYLRKHDLKLHYILETHAHADHLTSASLLRDKTGAQIGIGQKICEIQETFAAVFNRSIRSDGSQFDKLIQDHESWNAGSITIKSLPTPGHTPACLSYLIHGVGVFTGDAIFMPDYGTGRCDFPGGSATRLYQSVTKQIFTLPDSMVIFVGHDYLPGGRELKYSATIAEQKSSNIHLTAKTSEEEFVSMREMRDKTLSAPRLLLPSLQINIKAGVISDPESNGKSYLKIPLTLKT